MEKTVVQAGNPEYTSRNGAWVHRSAELAEGVLLEPGAVVGPRVRIGRGTRIGAGAVIYGPATIGADNRIWAGAVLGGEPQDVHYGGEPTALEVGDGNVFREHVTVSRGSPKATGITRVGNRNYLMAGAHLGHDVVVEDNCVIANAALIAGHCRVGSGANLSGGIAIVQFTTVGRLVFLGGMCGVRQDLEPFLMHDRPDGTIHVRPCGVNRVGLRRAGVPEEVIGALRTAYKVLFVRPLGRHDLEEARTEIRRRGALVSEVEELLGFVARKQQGRYGRQGDTGGRSRPR